MDEKNKFKQKYNPKSNRLSYYDYSNNGAYFITICTKNMEHYFGKIVDGNMMLNDVGRMVQKYYLEIPIHFDFVFLDNFVIMPNHFHGIIIINNQSLKSKGICRDAALLHLYGQTEYYSCISPKKGDLGTIIRSFKSICKKMINKTQNNFFFSWQSNYYDRIIRNEDELKRIRKYILENPIKWEIDKNNTENIFM